MTPSSLRSRVLAFALVAAVLLAACGSTAPSAAEVDGATISSDQLKTDTAMFDFLTSLSGSPCGQPDDGETQDAACVRLTLTNLIQEELVKEYAAGAHLQADHQAVTGAISQIESAVGGAKALDGKLAERGLTRSALVALADRLFLFNAVQDALAKDSLTDERIQALYEQNIGDYTTIEVAHILVSTQKEADQIAAEATPKNFAELAAKRSQDQTSAVNGGSLGPLVQSSFVSGYDPTFVQAALALQPGQISEPVQTQFGWHVIYLKSRQVAPIADVRDQIVAAASGGVFQSWLLDRLAAAKIRVNPRYGMLDRATGQVVPVRSTNTDSPFRPTASPSAPPSSSP